MNLTQAKKIIDKTDWYYQGGASRPLYISYPLYACYLFKILGKKIPVKYDIAIYTKNSLQENYISKNSLKATALYYLAKQKQDKKFIIKLFSAWHDKFIKPYLKLKQEILDADLEKLSDSDLLKIFKKFSLSFTAVWHEAIFLDGFDYYGEKILEQALKKENKKINAEDLGLLLTPPLVTFTQSERLALLKIAEKVLKNKDDKTVKKDLKKISRDFYWLNNDFASIDYLTPEHFHKKLRELLALKSRIKEERAMRSVMKNLALNKAKLRKKYKLSSEFLNLTSFLALLGNFRDERKSYNQMAGNAIWKIAEELAGRTGLNINQIEHLYYWEIPDIFKKRDELLKLARLRLSGVIHLGEAYKKQGTFYGRDARLLNDYIKKSIGSGSELKGMPAYGGIVRSKVKIVRDKKDFFKMRPGDILVSQNTRPEFVPVMKIAGAIITDEGGITCHAAIVSRELKIPAVVGTQGATMKLKDGDIVEVNADRGIIKKIK